MLPVFNYVEPTTTNPKAKEVLELAKKRFGMVPNITKVMANNPFILKGWMEFNQYIEQGTLDPKLRELIAIVVSELNGCEYCLAAHTAIGKTLGLKEKELEMAREFKATEPKWEAALRFTHDLVVRRGVLQPEEVDRLRKLNFTEPEIIEMIAITSMTIFTNYFNLIARTEVDFPKVPIALKAIA
jgi:uncharacterized peroxidase-related enzyme